MTSLIRALLSCILLCTSAATLCGQTTDGMLTGAVVDPSGAVVAGAAVTITHAATGVQRRLDTNVEGRFQVFFLQPGRYRIEAGANGFSPALIQDLVVNAGDRLNLTLSLHLAPLTTDVTVSAREISTSPAVGTVIDRVFVGTLPLNGRSFQSLIALVPGVVTAPATTDSPGQFSVNGQRTNANYATVDGASANVGVIVDANTGQPPGQEAAGTTLGVNAVGGTHNLVPVDALEEFRLQTSTYSAEYGRQPGGQLTLITRSGTNRLAGTTFFAGRHDRFDATDWFINANRLPKARLRQRQLGAAGGGPVPVLSRSGGARLFFFAAYEGLDIEQPRVIQGIVPSLDVRRQAHPAVRPLVDAYPLPTGPADPITGRAPFVGSVSDPATVHTSSLRIDRAADTGDRLFARFSEARSVSKTGFIGTLETGVNTRTLTGGASLLFGPRLAQEVRVNYSHNDGHAASGLESWGGAVPIPFGWTGHPSISIPPSAAFTFTTTGNLIGESHGRGYFQRQWNVSATTTAALGDHTIKAGVDIRRLAPEGGNSEYQLYVEFNTPQAVANGTLTRGVVTSTRTADLTFLNVGAFVSDMWRISSRAALEAGFRWDVNPAPAGGYYTVIGLESLASMRVAPEDTRLYATQWANVGPRIGATYVLHERGASATLVRGGVGLFYDLGAGTGAQAGGYFPFVTSKSIPAGTPFPLTVAAAEPPAPMARTPPYAGQTFTAFAPGYRTPRTWQWSGAVDQTLGAAARLSMTYVGSHGSHLLRREVIRDPNPVFTGNSLVNVTRSVGHSRYHGLQLQLDRRLHDGLQVLASYTLGHARDTESSDAVLAARSDVVDLHDEWGSADFDVRHIFSAAATWQIPSARWPPLAVLTRDWALDGILRVRSAAPVDVVVNRDLGFGVFRFRPDRVEGQPLYLEDSALPGGRRINPAAFSLPAELRQGNLQRNSVRGFPLRQVDLSVRRDVRIGRSRVQLRVDSFNLFNTPNFSNPHPLLGSAQGQNLFVFPNWGRAGGLAAGQLGGLHRLYQVGGPRSFQFTSRFSF